MIKKIVISDSEKYLQIWGVRIPYYTERSASECRIIFGHLSFTYFHDELDGTCYIKIFGKPVHFRRNRRQRHYQLRDSLTDDKCRKILESELPKLIGYSPNLKNPRSFNEKVNWLKLNYHDPLVTQCCDKYSVKQYAANLIGDKYILPVLGAWDEAADIDFSALSESFVIKVNWSSGFNIIVRNKGELDERIARERIAAWMKKSSNSYYDLFNWGYKDMRPIIYAEPYIEQIDNQLYDYKFFFNYGTFLYMFIATDRYKNGVTYTFFGDNFKPLPFTYGHKPNASPLPSMPNNLYKMLEFGSKLAKPFPFVRVDFYEINSEQFYLGEMTFYSGGGSLKFDPIEWDYELGEKIKL